MFKHRCVGPFCFFYDSENPCRYWLIGAISCPYQKELYKRNKEIEKCSKGLNNIKDFKKI